MDMPPIEVLTPAALLGVGVLLILRGYLVPRKYLEDIEHDRDEWRTAHRISESARQEERDHNAALTRDIAEPLKGFLQGFRQAAAKSEVDDA